MNSPWNIAVEFKEDMSFSAREIAGMLEDYEKEHITGMDVKQISELIYEYTSGYPFLVSRLCKLIDEEVTGSEEFSEAKRAWTSAGFLEANRMLLGEKNTLFESMVNRLYDYAELKEMIYSILFVGREITYNALNQALNMAQMLGFVKNENGVAIIANRIFETAFYNFFCHLRKIRIRIHFNDLYGDLPDKFKEEDGRRYFLLYLKPIINGTGNYYVEARTRNMERTDVIVDYRGEQMVIEMKIWRGNAYKERGERQLADYLEHYHLKKGYMLSYNFNNKKEVGVKRIILGDKVLIEAIGFVL